MQGVHSWVRQWAVVNATGTAVTCDGASVSWAELDRRVDVYARHLSSLGVGPGDRVGCLMPNCVEYLETLYATSRIGAIFVPVNVRYTATELAFAAEHAGLRLLAADESFAAVISEAGLAAAVDWRADRPLAGPRFDGDDVARWGDDGYLLYTSGSTGRPRAALHAQESFLWASMDGLLCHRYGPDDRMLSALPLCFTGGLDVATQLAHCGGELVLMPSFDAGQALDLVESRRVTLFHGVPLMCQKLVDHPRWAGTDLSSMRLARTGAAPVPVALLRAWAQRGVPLLQGYGQTESAGSGLLLLAPDAGRYGKAGRASCYLDVRLVDPGTGADVPVGEVGELIMRGPQVMRGYWNDPEATAMVLRDGWLWTGDLAFVDEDGFYQIAGRSKDLIITGGLNVFPAEVEEVIRQVPGIAEVAVVGVPSERWGEAVVAVVVGADGDSGGGDVAVDLVAVQEHCRAVLADYKRPKRVVVSPQSLPRTASAKIIKHEVRRWVIDALAGSPAGPVAEAG